MSGSDGYVDTRSVLFTDVVGSTEQRVGLGEERADALRREIDDLQKMVVGAHGGVFVKGLGDGILATFPSAADSVAAAVALQQALGRRRQADPSTVELRIGLSIGDVSIEGDDVFGVPVVEASRLCNTAAPGRFWPPIWCGPCPGAGAVTCSNPWAPLS